MRLIEEILYRKTQSLPIQILLPSRKAEFLQLGNPNAPKCSCRSGIFWRTARCKRRGAPDKSAISGICLPMRIFRSKSGSLIFGAMLKDYQK